MPLDGRFEEVGPSRPAQAEVHPSQMYNNAQLSEYAGPSTGKIKGLITDEVGMKGEGLNWQNTHFRRPIGSSCSTLTILERVRAGATTKWCRIWSKSMCAMWVFPWNNRKEGSKLISEFAGSRTECQGESAEEPDAQSIGRVESSPSACCPGHGRSECSQKTSNHLLGQNGKYPIEAIMNLMIHKDFGNLTSQIKSQNISTENSKIDFSRCVPV